MQFCRFRWPGRGPGLGVLREGAAPGDAIVADLGAAGREEVDSPLPWLRRLARGGAAAEGELARLAAAAPAAGTLAELERHGLLLPPVHAPEVWAAGVTYERSRDARDRETQAATAGASPYDRVYAAARPELFLKATAWRVTGPGGPVGLRGDSRWQVPEPELGLVLDQDGTILGYTLGNDMSSRDIEGDNPLYLPQAKIFRHSCSLGPVVLAAGEAAGGFAIACTVRRGGQEVWRGTAHTGQMRRPFAELVAYLVRYNWIQPGTVLLTGTGTVPPDDFTLAAGDEIEISSPAIGALRNVVTPA